MNIGELITYCTLKDRVHSHSEIEKVRYGFRKYSKAYKTTIQSRCYFASIIHGTRKGTDSVISFTLTDYYGKKVDGKYVDVIMTVSYDKMVECLLGTNAMMRFR